jgi:hypothetical protein
MKCDKCPFHMTCFMGRLGWPDVLVVCPKCENLMFIIEQRFVDVGPVTAGAEALAEAATAIHTDLGIDIIPDPEVDPESMLVTVNGRRVMARVDGKKQAHVIYFKCEQRPMTSLWRAMYDDAVEGRHEELINRGEHRDFEPVVVNVEDPGPGHQDTLLIKKCIGCAGGFGRAHEYYAIHMHNPDNGDPLEFLDEVF